MKLGTGTLKDFLSLNQGKGKYTWAEIGNAYNRSGNAARKVWSRMLKQTPTVEEYFPTLPNQEKKDGLYLVLGCVHAPFVNKSFWKAMLKLARDRRNEISGLILNGDFLDLHSLSAYDKGKLAIKDVNLGMEYEGGRAYLDSILTKLDGDIYKAFMYGNHEFRYNKYMKQVDNSKLGGALPAPEDALNLKGKGFEVYTDWVNDEIQLGDLTIIHGEFCNVYPTKKYIDVFKRNFLFNHTHRVQMYREGEHVAYNAGTMADFDSPVFNYASKAMKKTWSNAFAIVNLYKGTTSTDIVVWNEDHFSYGGKIYT